MSRTIKTQNSTAQNRHYSHLRLLKKIVRMGLHAVEKTLDSTVIVGAGVGSYWSPIGAGLLATSYFGSKSLLKRAIAYIQVKPAITSKTEVAEKKKDSPKFPVKDETTESFSIKISGVQQPGFKVRVPSHEAMTTEPVRSPDKEFEHKLEKMIQITADNIATITQKKVDEAIKKSFTKKKSGLKRLNGLLPQRRAMRRKGKL